MYTLEIYENNYFTRAEMKRFFKDGYEFLLDGNTPTKTYTFVNCEDVIQAENMLYKQWELEGCYFEDGLAIQKLKDIYRVNFTMVM